MSVNQINSNELNTALLKARERYCENNPKSAAAHQQARQFMPGGNTRTVLFYDPFPLRVIAGKGARITDADGHNYVNLLGEYTAGLFGHSHPVIRAAIDDALDSGVNLSAHNPHEIRLAQLLCERFSSIDSIRFTNSGTEANLMAITSASLHTGKDKVMVMHGGYHGGLLYFVQGNAPVNAPFDFIIGQFNEIDATRDLIRKHANSLACILVEPVMGAGGCLPADFEFLNMLRAESEKCGAVLIFDEVMTSRLAPGGAQQLYDVNPDLTTLGKYIGGGMSFGAFGGAYEIMKVYDPEQSNAVPHAGTFNNNTLSMAAGVAAIEKVYVPEVVRTHNARGDALRHRLNSIAKDFDVPVCFTGTGSMMNLHGCREQIRIPAQLEASDDRIKQLIFLNLLEHGFYIARRGFIALMLPLEDTDLDAFLDSFESIVERCSKLQ